MISLLYAHPYAQHAPQEQQVLETVKQWPGLELRQLYQLYPDFYIDVALEQKMLLHSRAIILHYPMQLGLPPALLVQYLHKVFHYGWAYGQEEAGQVAGALQGKKIWVVTHAVASQQDPCYLQEMLSPLHQLALCCGLQWLTPLLLPDLIDSVAVESAAGLFRQGLEQLSGPHTATEITDAS